MFSVYISKCRIHFAMINKIFTKCQILTTNLKTQSNEQIKIPLLKFLPCIYIEQNCTVLCNYQRGIQSFLTYTFTVWRSLSQRRISGWVFWVPCTHLWFRTPLVFSHPPAGGMQKNVFLLGLGRIWIFLPDAGYPSGLSDMPCRITGLTLILFSPEIKMQSYQ